MDFEIIKNPHLPTGKVCHLLCGTLPECLQNSLLQYVDSLLITDTEPNIEQALRNHADICACPITDNRIILSKSQMNLKEKLNSLGFYVIIQENICSPYPNDCLLNFINTTNYSIINNNHNTRSICQSNSKVIKTKQGYVKCSVAPISKNAILTDDPSIAKAAVQQGIETCFVSKGDVQLNGYPYGFIGGCCGKTDENHMAFCGNLESHRDYKIIAEFLKHYDIVPINLLDSQLTDVGSLIPLTQMKG